jgi:hypothetical protein
MDQKKICHAAKAVERRKFIATNAYSKKEERPKVHNLTLYPKNLEKKVNIIPKPAKGGV